MEHQQKLIFQKNQIESNEIKNKFNEILKMEEKNNRFDLKHENKLILKVSNA